MSLQVIIVLLKFAFLLDKHFGLLLQFLQLPCQLIDMCVGVLERLMVFVLDHMHKTENPCQTVVLADKDRVGLCPVHMSTDNPPFFSAFVDNPMTQERLLSSF